MTNNKNYNIDKYLTSLSETFNDAPDILAAIETLKKSVVELEQKIVQHLSYTISQNQTTIVPTTTKKHKRYKDWSTAGKQALSSALYYRKKHNLPIEPELAAALTKTVPGYDAQTNTIKKDNTTPRVTTTDWASLSKAKIYSAFVYRKKRGRQIEPGLNAEMIAKFPGYDAQTQTITKRPRRPRTLDWSTKNKRQLQNAFYKYKRAKKPIPAELTSALVATFPNYDPASNRFIRRPRKKKTPTTNQVNTTPIKNTTLPLYSKKTTSDNYCLVFDDGTTTKNILTASKIPFELYLIDTKTKTAVVRKQSVKQTHLLFVVNYSNGNVSPDSRCGFQRICYDEQNHALFAQHNRDTSRHFVKFEQNGTTSQAIQIPNNTQEKKLQRNETVVIDENGNVTKHPLLTLGETSQRESQDKIVTEITKPAPLATPQIDETKTEQTIAPTPHTERVHTAQKKKTKSEPKSENDLVVTIKPVRTTLDGTYNNVFVNGKKILSNHFNTEIKLLVDDTILAIHGIVTDNQSLPRTPIWQVYGTDLRSRVSLHKQKFSGYNIHAKHIAETADGLRIELSNRCSCLLKTQRLLNEAGKKRFITDQTITKQK